MGNSRRNFLLSQIIAADPTKNTEDIFNGDLEETYHSMVNSGKISAGSSLLNLSRKRDRPDPQLVQQVMATPPTVTIGGSGAASTIASAQSINSVVNNAASPVFSYAGAPQVVMAGVAYPDYMFVRSSSVTTTNTFSSPMTIEFEFDGPIFEFYMKGLTGQAFRLRVDGKLATLAPNTAIPTDGGLYLIKVDLSTRANRRIQIELSGGYFGGLRIGPNDTVWPLSQKRGIRCVILGDSYTEGTGSTAAVSGYWKTFADLMNWTDVVNSGVGSTGYLATSGGRVKFRDRLNADILAYTPDVVIVAGGHNDTGFVNSDIQAEAALLFALKELYLIQNSM